MNVQRILFVNSLDADYLEDLTFAGLTEILGADNVISYPTNHHYYYSKYQYPKNIGQCRPMFRYILDRLNISNQLKRFEFDAIVLGSVKKDSCVSFLRLIETMPKRIPLIFLDGGDRHEVGGDAIRENFVSLFNDVTRRVKFDIIFKRECLISFQYESNVIPFPFSFKAPVYEMQKKKYDVVFWAVESDPIRSKALDLVRDRFDCTSNGTAAGQTFRHYRRKGKYFLEELSASKIVYNFKGVGWDTLRYWEVPGVGSFMISGEPKIQIPNNFQHGKHLVFCKDDLSDLLSLTEYYLRNEHERVSIAKSGYQHLQQHHTYRKRAEYFLDVLRSHKF